MEKSALRERFKNLRVQLPKSERSAAAKKLTQNLQRFLRDHAPAQHCVYQARPDEAPCEPGPMNEYFYPLMLQGEKLEFRRPRSAADFKTGSFSIAEPVRENSSALDLSEPVVVCCPAVAVDAQGNRLGHGKGFYDRFFAQHPQALRVGVVFHVQFSNDPLPAESWDQKLDWIVSEKMILRTHTRSSQSWT